MLYLLDLLEILLELSYSNFVSRLMVQIEFEKTQRHLSLFERDYFEHPSEYSFAHPGHL